MEKVDYYEELEIDREATQEEVKNAYKKLALVINSLNLEMASR